ncbi:superoxide dismutase family protein [Melittangium boletus]|uniref:Superoxide dismutase [Cu-Zn] n=1 Tax=Melittangium boletus DSM 14713 TaxID=1294270 RepID=A0A250IS97_9BACT|nr:superoxide dismutase family protein [Melittangium boletus]ATB34110.1 Superoxide dismutase [Cu-Zn] precursor [Melittangium boletus DSM 14713]
MKNSFAISSRITLLAAAFALSACGTSKHAIATLESRSGSSTTGSAEFSEVDDGVKLTLEVQGSTPGLHGAHIHETGDCSAADASSAGAHWNPTSKDHGPADPNHHLGDLGNIQINDDGKGTLSLTKSAWKIGDGSAEDVIGRAIIIHASEDDLVSNPAGNAGGRFACGVIVAK